MPGHRKLQKHTTLWSSVQDMVENAPPPSHAGIGQACNFGEDQNSYFPILEMHTNQSQLSDCGLAFLFSFLPLSF